MNYSETLKDPRWQKKRLSILERDEFKCRECGDTESTLNVHHKKYDFNKNPWDYNDSNLITLCENCHKEKHKLKKWLKDKIDFMPNVWLDEYKCFIDATLELSPSDIMLLTKFAYRLGLETNLCEF